MISRPPRQFLAATCIRRVKLLQKWRLQRVYLRHASSTYNPASIATALEQTRILLPRILPENTVSQAAPEKKLQIWNEVLTASPRPSEIILSIFGSDQWAPSRELVTALLRDPFASDASSDGKISQRWTGTSGNSLIIVKDAEDRGTFECPSSFLEQFAVPVRLQEFNSPNFLQDEETFQAFLHADIPLIVCNPLTTSPIELLQKRFLLQNPNTILVFASSSDMTGLRECHGDLLDDLNVLFVDPYRALVALDVLKADPGSPLAVHQYQDGFIQSGLSSIPRKVQKIVESSGHASITSVVQSLKAQTMSAKVKSAISVASAQLKDDQQECDSAYLRVSALRGDIERERFALGDRLTLSNRNQGAHLEKLARKSISVDMDKLTVWKMLTRVDEITTIIAAMVSKSFADLQTHLVYDAGRFSTLQNTYNLRMTSVLRRLGSPFQTHVLVNELSQLEHSPSSLVKPNALLDPLTTRRHQIIQYPTARLHVAAQRSVLGLSWSAVTGLALGWAGWVQSMSGGASILNADAPTLMGAGGLVIALGIRWVMGYWEKSKRRWWADWERIYHGLERDLDRSSKNIVDNQVLVVADRGCSVLQISVEKRNREIAELLHEVSAINSCITSKTGED